MSERRTDESVEPVVKEITVGWPVDRAFERFTAEIGRWWPLGSHSVGQERARTCAFEPRAGGRLYETTGDGSEHVWGHVTIWDPPRRVAFTWHPGRDADTRQEVEVAFDPVDGETRVRLVHAGWERLGEEAEETRARYVPGWDFVLDRYAES